ncbi:MAG TPA: hypothetical protein VJ963_11740 [Bacteroidales bacterium]|nr:hypothetical protein [Bacteroidales bacterium]
MKSKLQILSSTKSLRFFRLMLLAVVSVMFTNMVSAQETVWNIIEESTDDAF